MQLHRSHAELEAASLKVLLISFGSPDEARAWRRETGVPFPILFDPQRSVYAAYGLGRSALRSWSPSTLAFYLRALFRGERLPAPRGDPHQMGGDFLLDRSGRLLLAHLSRDPVDRPDIATLLAAARAIAGPEP